MNWRDSIGASDIGHAGGVPEAEKLTQRLVPYSVNKGYASNPRRFNNKTYICIKNPYLPMLIRVWKAWKVLI